MAIRIRRREFIDTLGGAAAWPLAARAQQPALPVIGFLSSVSPGGPGNSRVDAFREAEGQLDLLPELAADLVRRNVSVIAAPGTEPGARAAKDATATIPIVFGVAEDPVALGLVASLARPGGNATGFNYLSAETVGKRVGLLRELLPGAKKLGVLINPRDATRAEIVLTQLRAASHSLGLEEHVLNAGTSEEIDAAFAAFARQRMDALFVGPDPLFNSRRVQFALMAVRHAIPAVYGAPDYVDAGCLMSYGASIPDIYRQVGVYTGRNLEGCKAGRLAGRAVNQVRTGHQPAGGEGARTRNSADATRPRRPGDRVRMRLAALHLVRKGTTRKASESRD